MPESPAAYLLDIEGTTTPIDFVYTTLFPYAAEALEEFLVRHGAEAAVRADVAALHGEHAAEDPASSLPPWEATTPQAETRSAIAYVRFLMQNDRKSTALKSLQGKIWQEGYEAGTLKGEVFADVPQALERWNQRGAGIYIYSSGSVLAQKLLFSTTPHGDLTAFLHGYFDTTTGPKLETASYMRIAREIGQDPGAVCFVSDNPRELVAAQAAGMAIVLSHRPGNPETTTPEGALVVSDFAGLP